MPYIPRNALRMTEDEYFEYESFVERPNEYAYGAVYMRHGKNVRHSTIASNLSVLLGMPLKDDPDLAVLGWKMRTWLSPANTFRFPDLLVVKWRPDLYKNRNDCIMNPIVLVEIVSPETALVDRQDKLQEYLSTLSVQEYVMVSEDEIRVEHYSRRDNDDWLYRIRTNIDGTIHLPSIDYTLQLSKVYAKLDLLPDS